MLSISYLQGLNESEDKVEFKEAKGGNVSYNGGSKPEPSKRRRCILGYVTAFANEGGGLLVFGMKDEPPHEVVGSEQSKGTIGDLESKIYSDTGIRVTTEELYEEGKRVFIIKIPSRPAGKVYKFEDVALMRVGEELKPMSDEHYLKIIQEQEPDFSEKYCENVSISDLDERAIQILKEMYARKQNNPHFLTLDTKQILSDLSLINGNKVTNAAILLLAKDDVLRREFPQSGVNIEYRGNESQIVFDQRKQYIQPYFVLIETLWEIINLRNGSFKIQEGPYIFDVPFFNQEVIREAINNAIAHRDYRRTSEIVIKQYPNKLDIISPGGFPIGVNLDNLLTVTSTPRNRLLTDILQKTGIVERSGQGIDKIFYKTLTEGKQAPDFSRSDDFQVELSLSAYVEDKAFALFVQSIQEDLSDDDKLSVFEILLLDKIRKGAKGAQLDSNIVSRLLNRNLIEKRGRTKGTYYILSKDYYEFIDEKGKYSKKTIWDEKQAFILILQHLKTFKHAKMSDFVQLFDGNLTRRQVRSIIGKLIDRKDLQREGSGKTTTYTIGQNSIKTLEEYTKETNSSFKKMNKN